MVGQAAPQAGTPASMRALNQRLVLDRLRGHGEATRPQIAIDTGLSKPTVGQALLDLEQQGLVRAIGRSAAGPGRSAVIYRTAPDAGHIVGVDIGRRVIRVAVADLDGGVVARVDRPNRSRSGTMLQRNACDAVESTIAEAGLSPHDIVVTVVGTPGIPDAATGTVHRAPNLPGWERRGLLHELVAALGAGGSEVMVENDANLSVVGEHARGAAQGVDVVACLTVGTGIGMGVLLNGILFRGAHGAAGEIADLPFDRVPPGVTQHRPGPVEIAAAAQAVVAAANELGLSRVNSARLSRQTCQPAPSRAPLPRSSRESSQRSTVAPTRSPAEGPTTALMSTPESTTLTVSPCGSRASSSGPAFSTSPSCTPHSA